MVGHQLVDEIIKIILNLSITDIEKVITSHHYFQLKVEEAYLEQI